MADQGVLDGTQSAIEPDAFDGAELVALRLRGKHAVFCAKLHHDNHKRCIFHCNYRNQTTLKEMM